MSDKVEHFQPDIYIHTKSEFLDIVRRILDLEELRFATRNNIS